MPDARRRAGAHYGSPVVEGGRGGEGVAGALVRLGTEHRLEGWVAMRPAVGPLGDIMVGMEKDLASSGLGMRWCRHAWDERLWPHAQAGFFPFWEKVRGRMMEGVVSGL